MLLRLRQQEQLSSRLAQVVKFDKLSIDEVVMAAAELCGLELSEAAAEVLHKRCRGFFRDLVVALAALERTSAANKTKTPPAEMADKVARTAIMRAA